MCWESRCIVCIVVDCCFFLSLESYFFFSLSHILLITHSFQLSSSGFISSGFRSLSVPFLYSHAFLSSFLLSLIIVLLFSSLPFFSSFPLVSFLLFIILFFHISSHFPISPWLVLSSRFISFSLFLPSPPFSSIFSSPLLLPSFYPSSSLSFLSPCLSHLSASPPSFSPANPLRITSFFLTLSRLLFHVFF